MKPLVLIGVGGHCRSVIEAAESAGREVMGILDTPDKAGGQVLGRPVIGSDDDMEKYVGRAEFVITVGHIRDCVLRRKLAERVEAAGGTFGLVVASTAHVSRYARIGAGTVVLHGAMVNAGAEVGRNCIVNTLANVEHDAVVGDFCHISTGAMVNGDCRVGEGTFLGSQSVLLNGAEIEAGCTVAAGSFVRKSLRQPGLYAGNPAILMKKARP